MTDWSLYFGISSSVDYVASFNELGIAEPYQDSYEPFSVEVEAMDLLTYGHGIAKTALRWGFIKLSQRNILKTFCPGKSAIVYARIHDDDWDWVYCKAVAIWQRENPPILVEGGERIIPEFILNLWIVENYGASLP